LLTLLIKFQNVETVLVNQTYHPGKTSEWIDEISNKILQQLAEQQKSFKYVGKYWRVSRPPGSSVDTRVTN